MSTRKGLQAFVPIAENPGSAPKGDPDLGERVSAILAPDALAALQKRKTVEQPRKADSPVRQRSSRHNNKAPAIETDSPAFSKEIKTTHDLSRGVSAILGKQVLGNLKASCAERKEQEEAKLLDARKQKSVGHVSKLLPPEVVAAMEQQKSAENSSAPAKSSLLTPEMVAAMQRSKATGSRASVAPQAKKKLIPTQEENSNYGNGEGLAVDSARGRRRGHPKGKSSSRSPPGTKKSHPPKPRPSNTAKSKGALRHKHEQDFVNHAEDVGIDLEDGMDEIFDNEVEEESSKKSEQRRKPQSRSPNSKQQRVRKPRGADTGGAAPRRGRNGRRGAGGQRNIKSEQMAQMTAVDQTPQFREDEGSAEEQQQSEEEPEEEEPGSGQVDDGSGRLLEKAANRAKNAVGAVFGVGDKGLNALGATKTGGAALHVGENVFSGLGTLATTAARTTTSAATTVTKGATSAATTVTKGATSAATSVTHGATSAATSAALSVRKVSTLDQYSSSDDDDDDDDEPPSVAGDGRGTWGFTGGGMAPQLK